LRAYSSGYQGTRSHNDSRTKKKTLAAMLANVAEVGAERMEETIGKAKLRDAAIGTGIAVDKMLALTGQMPAVAVQVVLPTPEERAERRARHGQARLAVRESLAEARSSRLSRPATAA